MPMRPGLRRPLLMFVVMLIAGCGAETYQARIKETALYFGYKQKLAEELGPVWSAGGVAIQPPKQFQLIPAPAPPPVVEGEESEEVDDAEDPRQPHFLGIELPGLLGAWEANVRAERGGTDEVHKAYLYVLGNHSRYLSGKDETGFSQPPPEFLTDVENLLSGTIGVVLPEGETGKGVEKNQRYRESAPRAEPNVKFTPRKDFTAITLSPQIDVGDLELPFEMQLYEWGGQHVQVALLMVYPQSISPQEKLQERLLLALETLDIADVAPTAATQTEAGGAPGGGSARPSGF